jgi:hypothetical protein
MAFLAVALVTGFAYAAWVLWVPLLPDNLYTPLLDLGKITGYTWRSALTFLFLVLGLYALYGLGYRLIRRGNVGLAPILVMGAVFCFELVWAYPATAIDVFAYVAHGRLLAVHGLNPLIFAPHEFPGDPIIPFLAFPDEPSQYGPVWVIIGGALSALANGNLLTEVLAYKALAALAHLGGGVLVYLIAQGLGADAPDARASAYVYVWNPLLLWEMVGNAHNDGGMMFFGLVAVWLFVVGAHLLVLPAVAVGALVKVPLAFAAPVLLVGIWHRGRAKAIEGALLAVVLCAVVYRPFWDGLATLTALRRADLFTASAGSVLRVSLGPSLGQADATTLARWLSLGGFGAVALVMLWLAMRAETNQDIVRLAYFTLLAGLLLATTWFQAWYVIWPLAIAATLAEPRRHMEVTLLSLGGFLQYFVFIYLWVMGLFPPTDNLGVQGAAYVCIIGPVLLYVALRALGPSIRRPALSTV